MACVVLITFFFLAVSVLAFPQIKQNAETKQLTFNSYVEWDLDH